MRMNLIISLKSLSTWRMSSPRLCNYLQFSIIILTVLIFFSVPHLLSCEVYDPDLVDKGLEDTYEGLPLLPGYIFFFFNLSYYLIIIFNRGKRMLCRNSEVQTGYAYISHVADQLGCDFQYVTLQVCDSLFIHICRDFSIRHLKKLIKYSGSTSNNVVNLSRVDPALLLLSYPVGKWKTQYIVYKNSRKPAICFMIGLATHDATRSPISFNSKGETLFQKSISIVPITLESERHISTICTILNVDEYWCQFDNNALKFATIPGPIKDGGM
jgi:hypothetical protein